jgi:hypothetical protein
MVHRTALRAGAAGSSFILIGRCTFPARSAGSLVQSATCWESLVWYGIGTGLGILYVVLLLTLGILTLRKGHWIMFIVGIPLPVFWLVGALIPPKAGRTA